MQRSIALSKVERTFQHTDHVVAGLLAPSPVVCDAKKMGASNLIKHEAADSRAPDVIEYLLIRPHRRCSQVVALETGFTGSEVIVEDVIAQTDIANKQSRQAAWEKYCDDKRLSVEERNRAASIIRPGASIKVLAWPSL